MFLLFYTRDELLVDVFFLIHVAGSIVTDIVAPSIPFQLKIYIYYEI